MRSDLRASARLPATWLALLALTLGAPGCARRAGAPPIRIGTSCAGCGMSVSDLRFACEREAGDGFEVYDSIECLLRADSTGRAWLADYDSRTLHAADSLWVVRGDFPSPMGGGFAAFRDRAAADEIAARTRGTTGRLAQFRAAETETKR